MDNTQDTKPLWQTHLSRVPDGAASLALIGISSLAQDLAAHAKNHMALDAQELEKMQKRAFLIMKNANISGFHSEQRGGIFYSATLLFSHITEGIKEEVAANSISSLEGEALYT